MNMFTSTTRLSRMALILGYSNMADAPKWTLIPRGIIIFIGTILLIFDLAVTVFYSCMQNELSCIICRSWNRKIREKSIPCLIITVSGEQSILKMLYSSDTEVIYRVENTRMHSKIWEFVKLWNSFGVFIAIYQPLETIRRITTISLKFGI